jgi:hypothetical protein
LGCCRKVNPATFSLGFPLLLTGLSEILRIPIGLGIARIGSITRPNHQRNGCQHQHSTNHHNKPLQVKNEKPINLMSMLLIEPDQNDSFPCP